MRNLIATVLTACALAGGTAALASPAPASAAASTHASHALPPWVRWTWASRAARADCHGGPAIIVWVGDSDQSVLICKKNAVIWPS